MPVDQMLHLKLAERPVNNIMVITPPDETESNLEKAFEPATGFSRIYRLTP
jgi:osomolarity two-component system sensor histidine kinase TcsA